MSSPLGRFVDRLPIPERRLVVCNRTEPEPVQRPLEGLFDEQPVEVSAATRADAASDEVLLLGGSTVVARSPLEALERAILFVNSDLYVTDARSPDEHVWPDGLAALQEVPFAVRGYPEAHHETLLLITVSRWIERLAAERGDGRLRSSFQRLSRTNGASARSTRRSPRRPSTSTSTASPTGTRRPPSTSRRTRATVATSGRAGSSSRRRPIRWRPTPRAAADDVAPAVAAAAGVAAEGQLVDGGNGDVERRL